MTPSPAATNQGLPYRIVRFAVEASWWLVLAIPLLFVFTIPVGTGSELRFRTPVSLEIEEPSFRIVRLSEGQTTDTVVVPEDLQGSLSVGTGPETWIVFVVFYLVALAVVWLVRSVIRSLRQAPFDRRNVWRIRTIGLILLGFQVARPLLAQLRAAWVTESFRVEGARLSAPTIVGLTDLLYPLLLLVLAEVFRRGARIEEDRALTV